MRWCPGTCVCNKLVFMQTSLLFLGGSM
jgi:hypothetical protein